MRNDAKLKTKRAKQDGNPNLALTTPIETNQTKKDLQYE
jgi:hypothetical protein